MKPETINGYEIDRKLTDDKYTITYRVKEKEKPYILKCLKPEYTHNYEAIARLHYEYTINQKLKIKGILKAIKIVSGTGKESELEGILFEDFSAAMTLEQYLSVFQKKLKDKNQMFFQAAIPLTQMLSELHAQNLIHKNLSTRNILVKLDTREIRLSGFNLTTKFSTSQQEPEIEADKYPGDVRFISPEQTGRIAQPLDFRTDLYALGHIFYALVCGENPFEMDKETEAQKIVHLHLTAKPLILNAEAPEMIVQLIYKLMAKPAADRYPNAEILLRDLKHCEHQYQKFGAISKFPIAAETAAIFAIPDKIYGREPEIKELETSYQNIKTGATELKFVTGYSGIGKTSIVNELELKVTKNKGLFIKGKYDQYNRSPYSGIFSAFETLFQKFSAEKNHKEIARLRKNIFDKVGQEGQVLIEFMPSLHKLLGSQPPVENLPESMAKTRFFRLFTSLLQVLATKDQPLVLFADDLQWADAASLNLMQDLLQGNKVPYLLMIGAYRDNEINKAHILNFAIHELEKSNLAFSQLILKPLPEHACNELVADTLNTSLEHSQALTGMLIKKTNGNPFFLKQLFHDLYLNSHLKYDGKIWVWDIDKIRLLNITENVVDFMIERLGAEDTVISNYLAEAAVIGNTFDLATIKAVHDKQRQADFVLKANIARLSSRRAEETEPEKTAQEIATKLFLGIETGYLIPINFSDPDKVTDYVALKFKFAHDRIQEAAYRLLGSTKRLEQNLAVARYRKQLYKEILAEKVFEIVPYYNQALKLFPGDQVYKLNQEISAEEKVQIIQLNIIAAKKARSTVSYADALDFALIAQSLLEKDAWQKDFAATKDLYIEIGELYQINGEFKKAETTFDICLKHLPTKTKDIIGIYTRKVKLYTASSEHQKAIQTGLKGLQMLGIRLSENPNMASISLNLLKVKTKLGFRKADDLKNLPEMQDERALLAMQLMVSLATTVYQTNQNLGFLLVLKMFLLSLDYGNSADSSFSYMAYALALCTVLKKYTQGYEFGTVALELNEKYQNYMLKPILYELFGSLIMPWSKPLREAIPYLKTAYQAGEETGDTYYAALAAINIIGESIISGDFLNNIDDLINFYTNFIKKQKFANTAFAIEIYRTLVLKLTKIESNRFNKGKLIKDIKKIQDKNALSLYYIFDLITSYHLSIYKDAISSAEKFAELITYSRGLYYIPDYYFYYSLTIMALYQDFTKEEQANYLKILNQNLLKMKKWSKLNAANFEPKVYLLKAELARIQNNNSEANELYDQAIESAKTYQFIQVEAIANECKAKHCLELKNNTSAQLHFLQAHHLYTKWGAIAKAQQLEKKYPEMFAEMLAKQAAQEKKISAQTLDMQGLSKDIQELSFQIDLDKLLKQLTDILIKHSGANKIAILLQNKDKLELSVNFGESPDFPESIIKEIQKNKQELILNNPENKDTYLQKYQPKSVLALPLLKQNDLIGVVYLENTLLQGCFQDKQINTLRIITAQAVNALENCRVYGEIQVLQHQLEEKTSKAPVQDEELAKYIDELKQKASYADLTQHIAHEIRNPLGFIQGDVEVLEDNRNPAEVKEYLGCLKEDVRRLIDLMETMLEFGKPVNKVEANVDVNEIIQKVDMLSKGDLGRKTIQLKLNLEADLPKISIDKGKLRQSVINIILNGSQAIGEKGNITIKTTKADFKNLEGKKQKGIMIKIANDGPPMPQEIKDHIFDTFYTTKEKGSGIGLSVVLNMVKDHHGKIEIETQKNETAFVIYLPVK
jgi:predicted ATPase/nitrogen-specific signal transduction histidine kinase